jgi:hypothetical protein
MNTLEVEDGQLLADMHCSSDLPNRQTTSSHLEICMSGMLVFIERADRCPESQSRPPISHLHEMAKIYILC